MVLLLTLLMIKQMNHVTQVRRKRATLKQGGGQWFGRRWWKIHSLSDKLPPNVELTRAKGDLEQKDYQNLPDLWKQDELASPNVLFELFFDEELLYHIVELTNLYGERDKVDTVRLNYRMKSFDCLWQFCLWMVIISSLNDGCIGKQHLIHLCRLFLIQYWGKILKGSYNISTRETTKRSISLTNYFNEKLL